ncbi:MAG: sodium:alanine symporter family protein, partial [Clostridia bacterium]|nr:sodium:alanine symporter family protein [Clostridia bacterium]
VVICSLTAYTVLIAERRGIAIVPDGMTAASAALSAFIPHADMLLCAAVLIFAFCTVICWFHYGAESLAYLGGGRRARRLYALLYACCAAAGCFLSGGIVWSLADLTISAMTAVNIAAVLLRADEVKSETDNYFSKSACKFVNTDIPKEHYPVEKKKKMW